MSRQIVEQFKNGEIQIDGDWYTITETGAVINKAPETFGVFDLTCAGLALTEHSLPCVIGDILNAGEDYYGQDWAQATVHFAPRKYQTLMNYRSTCKSVPIGNRLPGLHFGHYQAVRTLEDDQQIDWQRKAKQNDWTPKELRQAIKGKPNPLPLLHDEIRKAADRLINDLVDKYAFEITDEIDQEINLAYTHLLAAGQLSMENQKQKELEQKSKERILGIG